MHEEGEVLTDSEGFYEWKGLMPGETYSLMVLDDLNAYRPSMRKVSLKEEDVEEMHFL